MKSFDNVNEDPIRDLHYQKRMLALSELASIVTALDVNPAAVQSPAGTGLNLDRSLHDSLLQNKLIQDSDQYPALENRVTPESLSQQAQRMLMNDVRLKPILSAQDAPNPFSSLLENIPLNPAIAIKLSVMRDAQPDLFDRSLFVALVSAYLGREIGMDGVRLIKLTTAALLRDIGMLHIHPDLLATDHVMSDVERRHLYLHPVTAWMILKNYPEYDQEILEGVLQHHETLDGRGYPRGLQTDALGLFGQIIGLAEVVTSIDMTADAVYGRARLETILKFNSNKFHENLTQHLRGFYQGNVEGSASIPADGTTVEEKTSRIYALFTAWDDALEKIGGNHAIGKFTNDRVQWLKRLVNEAGLTSEPADPQVDSTSEDPGTRLKTHVFLDETLWQVQHLVRDLRRRWPALNHENTNVGFREVARWIQVVEQAS
jgi:HD-GYP domain-containing protein (c-di-GMP phosphodiesterase class II)